MLAGPLKVSPFPRPLSALATRHRSSVVRVHHPYSCRLGDCTSSTSGDRSDHLCFLPAAQCWQGVLYGGAFAGVKAVQSPLQRRLRSQCGALAVCRSLSSAGHWVSTGDCRTRLCRCSPRVFGRHACIQLPPIAHTIQSTAMTITDSVCSGIASWAVSRTCACPCMCCRPVAREISMSFSFVIFSIVPQNTNVRR